MNLASQSGEAGSGQLLFANFNQDNTSLKSLDPFSARIAKCRKPTEIVKAVAILCGGFIK